MTKKFMVVSISCVFLLLASICSTESKNINISDTEVQYVSKNTQLNSNEPNEQIYYNLLVTFLYPYVEEAIDNYYDVYMTFLPGEAPYSYKFTNIEMTPSHNYSYTIALEVQPYVGPHLSVGRDRIAFKIDLKGVKVEKFEHIESYELPPHYQNIFKKKLPNP